MSSQSRRHLSSTRLALDTLFVLTDEVVHTVFGKPLRESLKYASVQISTANANGELYVWGHIPVVVAKWYVLRVSPRHKTLIKEQWLVFEREGYGICSNYRRPPLDHRSSPQLPK